MSMSDNPEALPELPEPDFTSYQTDSVMRQTELRSYSASQMRAYARAALAQQAATPPNPQPDGGYPGCDVCTCPTGRCDQNRPLAAPAQRLANALRAGDPELNRADVRAVLDALAAARQAATPAPAEPVAWVPVHPRNGPLWANTTGDPSPERLPSYALMPLYVAPPATPAAIPDECSATGRSCSYGPHGPKGERQCEYCGDTPATPAAQPADGWIAVADRVPEEHVPVLAWCASWPPNALQPFLAQHAHPFGFLDTRRGGQLISAVTHWRPLPAAPSEGSQG